MNKKNIVIVVLTALLLIMSGLFYKTKMDLNVNSPENNVTVNEVITYQIPDKYVPVQLAGNQTVNNEQELSPVGPELNSTVAFPEFRIGSNRFTIKNYSTLAKTDSEKTKLVYFAPSIDTPVCEKQTKIIQQFAKDHPEILVYVITSDTPFAIDRFCTDKSIKNVEVLSGFDQQEWLKQNNLFLKNYSTPTRMIMAFDSSNKLIHKNYEQEITKETNVINTLAYLKENNLLK
jgi:thiol peroxidase